MPGLPGAAFRGVIAKVDDEHDLLSEVVQAVKLQASSYYRAEIHGDFALCVPQRPKHIRFHMVLSGGMYIETPSRQSRTEIRAGDVYLVTQGAPHTISSSPKIAAVPLEEAKRRAGFKKGQRAPFRWGEGPPQVALMCGEFSVGIEFFHPVFGSLPALLHAPARREDQHDAIVELLDFINRESAAGAPGWIAVANRISEVVMIHVLRSWIRRSPEGANALRALRDPRIKQALDRIHARPDEPWTVQALAAQANMSRTAFSTAFTALMEKPPMQYLTSWRMEVARSLLHTENLSIPEVAERVGYRSQASFTKAFRETVGTTPAAYRSAALAMR